jgi:hypothetical protein
VFFQQVDDFKETAAAIICTRPTLLDDIGEQLICVLIIYANASDKSNFGWF